MFRFAARIAFTALVAVILTVILDPLLPTGLRPPIGYFIMAGYIALAWLITGTRGYIKALAAGSIECRDVPFLQPASEAGFDIGHPNNYSERRVRN